MKRSLYAVWPVSVLALAVLAGSAGSTPSWAEDHHAKPHAGKAAAASASGAAGVWHELQEQVGELTLLVQRKKLSQVHEVAFEIRDRVRTLPAQSHSRRAAQQATESQHQHLLQVLQNIKRFYPSGALASKAPGKAHGRK